MKNMPVCQDKLTSTIEHTCRVLFLRMVDAFSSVSAVAWASATWGQGEPRKQQQGRWRRIGTKVVALVPERVVQGSGGTLKQSIAWYQVEVLYSCTKKNKWNTEKVVQGSGKVQSIVRGFPPDVFLRQDMAGLLAPTQDY